VVDGGAVPFVSVIIATRNRAALLAQTLDALAGQRWPRDGFEIVVADNGSVDRTADVVREHTAGREAPRIRYVYVAESGKSSAVNEALTQAKGDLLVFTDDDVLPEPAWIERLVAAFADTGADFAAGRILARWEQSPPAWMSPALYGVLAIPDNGPARIALGEGANTELIPIGANMAVRRRVIDKVGGLRSDLGKLEGTLRTGEDHEFFLRMLHAGCHGVYEPTAIVWHRVPGERLERSYFRRWNRQNGRDVARLEFAYTRTLRRWLGVPRYLWRRAIVDLADTAKAVLRADERRRFAASARLFWFSGYVTEVWFGRASTRAGRVQLAEER
jgi:glycosyltransferase involved in cell wall biosynthesis